MIVTPQSTRDRIEASDRVGGRVRTNSRDGYLIERGAQLITSTYRNALGLVKELGLEAELKPTSPWMAIVKDGRPRRMPSGAMFPIYALTTGLVSLPDLARFIWQNAETAHALRNQNRRSSRLRRSVAQTLR